MLLTQNIPLSLYIHLPWCIKKCPYCDFNSFAKTDELPEQAYIDALLHDLDQDLPLLANRPIISIFIGGGTPSLFSSAAIKRLLNEIRLRVEIVSNAEITMEANPGTFEQERFYGFKEAGINRLSLGVQSFNPIHLQKLGRIHGTNESLTAIAAAKEIGFNSVNVDLMYALPNQSVEEALADLEQAISLQPAHLSWYHLTIEPNTAFYRRPPTTPNEEITEAIETSGKAFLAKHGFHNYEVSAYSQANRQCVHNVNYWQFGDYLGIGAGAHSKITLPNHDVIRFWKHRLPTHYLDPQQAFTSNQKTLAKKDLIFEFMLNALRLMEGFSFALFEERTGIAMSEINKIITIAEQKKMLDLNNQHIMITSHGKRFLDDLVSLFLSESA